MKKYLHIPKKIFIVFCAIFVVAFGVSVFLYSSQASISATADFNIDKMLNYFLFTVIFGMITVAFFIAYVIRCAGLLVENINMENKNLLKLAKTIITIENILGVGLIVLFYHTITSAREIATKIKLNLNNLYVDESVKYEMKYVFVGLLSFLCLGIAIVFFVNAKRQNKLYKNNKTTIKREQENTVACEERNSELGFVYEECEFFKQTQLSYDSLKHNDGTRGEFEIFKQLREYENSGAKFAFNREIPKGDGLTTEIDVLMLHKNGIVVVENKDYSGIIYGKAYENTWTYIDSKGSKISIYNPVKQNEAHIKALKMFLENQQIIDKDRTIPIYSVIVFTDFKTNKSDEIISRINMNGNNTKLCTSQNLKFVVDKLLEENAEHTVDVEKVNTILMRLSVRKKY